MKINGYNLTPYHALDYIRGRGSFLRPGLLQASWQCLVVSGWAWHLGGPMAKVALAMIEEGAIYSKGDFHALFDGQDNAILPNLQEG